MSAALHVQPFLKAVWAAWIKCLLVVVALIPTSSGRAQIDSSHRTTVCDFEIGFEPGSSAISKKADSVITAAAAEARRMNTGRIAVQGYDVDDDPEMPATRVRAIINRLADAGVAGDIVVGKRLPEERITEKRQAAISICDKNRIDELFRWPPADPDRMVELKVGRALLHVPVRYLGPGFWSLTLSPQSKPINVAVQQVALTWPAMQDRTDPGLLKCLREGDGCDDLLIVTLKSNNKNPGGLVEEWKPSTVTELQSATWGVRFRISDEYAPGFVRFSDLAQDGRGVRGHCHWPEVSPATVPPRQVEEIDRLVTTGTCETDNLPEHLGYSVSFSFPGTKLRDLHAIESDVLRLLSRFETVARPVPQ